MIKWAFQTASSRLRRPSASSEIPRIHPSRKRLLQSQVSQRQREIAWNCCAFLEKKDMVEAASVFDFKFQETNNKCIYWIPRNPIVSSHFPNFLFGTLQWGSECGSFINQLMCRCFYKMKWVVLAQHCLPDHVEINSSYFYHGLPTIGRYGTYCIACLTNPPFRVSLYFWIRYSNIVFACKCSVD